MLLEGPDGGDDLGGADDEAEYSGGGECDGCAPLHDRARHAGECGDEGGHDGEDFFPDAVLKALHLQVEFPVCLDVGLESGEVVLGEDEAVLLRLGFKLDDSGAAFLQELDHLLAASTEECDSGGGAFASGAEMGYRVRGIEEYVTCAAHVSARGLHGHAERGELRVVRRHVLLQEFHGGRELVRGDAGELGGDGHPRRGLNVLSGKAGERHDRFAVLQVGVRRLHSERYDGGSGGGHGHRRGLPEFVYGVLTFLRALLEERGVHGEFDYELLHVRHVFTSPSRCGSRCRSWSPVRHGRGCPVPHTRGTSRGGPRIRLPPSRPWSRPWDDRIRSRAVPARSATRERRCGPLPSMPSLRVREWRAHL